MNKMPNVMVETEYVRPPIPTTMFDWVAYISGEEDGPVGRGPTEAEALRDLAEQLWMMVTHETAQ